MSSQVSGRILSGIGPIDQVLGGLEEGRCHLVVGRPGSGKTTLGAQFLITSLDKDERVIVVTRLSAQEIVDRFARLGYDYFAHGDSNDRLIIFEQSKEIVDHIRSLNDFGAVAVELEETIKEHKPVRVVFDPTSYLIEANNQQARDIRARSLVALLNRVQTTSILIVDEGEAEGVVAPLTELCTSVFNLNAKPDEKGISILEVAKTTDAEHQKEEIPVYVSAMTGITAAPRPEARAVQATQPLTVAPTAVLEAPTEYIPIPIPLSEPAPSPSATGSLSVPEPPAPISSSTGPQPTFDHEAISADKFHVLVIDDDPATCNLISRALRHDCNVTAVNDGASGLKKLSSGTTYDLIILDVNLPVVDGFHICQHIRKTQWQVPIIIVTGTHLRAEDRLHSASAGGDLYLTKPFSVHELRLRVRQMIGRYRNVSEWVGAGAGIGLESAISESVTPEHEDQFVAQDVFLQRLSRHTERARTVGLPFSIVGCTIQTNNNGSNKVSRMVDAVRYQIRERDVMTVTPEHQAFVLLSEANVDGVQVFVQRLRQSILAEVGSDPVIQWRTYPIDGENAAELLTEVCEDLKTEILAVERESSPAKQQTTEEPPPIVFANEPLEAPDDMAALHVSEEAVASKIAGLRPPETLEQPAIKAPAPTKQPEDQFFEFVIEEEEILREGDQTLTNLGAHVPQSTAPRSPQSAPVETSKPIEVPAKAPLGETDESQSGGFAFEFSPDLTAADSNLEEKKPVAASTAEAVEPSKELVLPQPVIEQSPPMLVPDIFVEPSSTGRQTAETKASEAASIAFTEPTTSPAPVQPEESAPIVTAMAETPVQPESVPVTEPKAEVPAKLPFSEPVAVQLEKPEPRVVTPAIWTESPRSSAPTDNGEVPAFATFFDNSFEQYRQIADSLNLQPAPVQQPEPQESSPRESFLQFLSGKG